MGGGGKGYGGGGTPIEIGFIKGVGGKFTGGGYGIGFAIWPNPGYWGRGIHTLRRPLACLLRLTNVMVGDGAQDSPYSSSSVPLLVTCASLSITRRVSVGNRRSRCSFTARDIEIARLPSAIVIGKTI